jgi:hypothetical protein
MTKRYKKSPVNPEMRRKWLQQSEEDGKSPPQIAKDDGYDVRTVRKQLELERQERERREARTIVLRNALEQHYGDLCGFAGRLSSQVSSERGSVALLREDRMCSSLREHLPRSVIWKNLDRWEYIRKQIEQLQAEMRKSFEDEVKLRAAAKNIDLSEETGIIEGEVESLSFHCKWVAQGSRGLNGIDFEFKKYSEEKTDVQLGAFNLGRVLNDQSLYVQELNKELRSEVTSWSSYYELEKLYADLKRTQRILEDELAIITLRRVVPGRCRYCPI